MEELPFTASCSLYVDARRWNAIAVISQGAVDHTAMWNFSSNRIVLFLKYLNTFQCGFGIKSKGVIQNRNSMNSAYYQIFMNDYIVHAVTLLPARKNEIMAKCDSESPLLKFFKMTSKTIRLRINPEIHLVIRIYLV